MRRSTGRTKNSIALLFAAEALRRGGAKRLVLLAPYLCYMRQDAAFHEGEAISQKVIGALLARMRRPRGHRRRASASHAGHQSGISRNRVRQSLGHAGDRGCAAQRPVSIQQPSSSGRMRNRSPGSATSPAGSGCPMTVATKDPPRRPLRRDRISRTRRCIAGRPALIVDDIVSSGGTMIACAKALTAAGATAIDAVVTHALFPEAALPRDDSIGHPLDPFDA